MVNPNITSRFNEIYDSTYKDVLAFVTVKCGNTADISDSSIGPTNMLRKGGVYLLPLQEYGGNGSERLMDEEYSVAGDLDVLFEIDDTGHVFSHSDFSGFNHYDGKPYTALADAIVNFAENPDFSLVGFHFLER